MKICQMICQNDWCRDRLSNVKIFEFRYLKVSNTSLLCLLQINEDKLRFVEIYI